VVLEKSVEMISWTDRVRNEEKFKKRIKKEESILDWLHLAQELLAETRY
jgi:hypothetical protein